MCANYRESATRTYKENNMKRTAITFLSHRSANVSAKLVRHIGTRQVFSLAGFVLVLSAGVAEAQQAIATARSNGRMVSPNRNATGTTGRVFAYSEANGIVNEDYDEMNTIGGGALPITEFGEFFVGGIAGVEERSWDPVLTTGWRNLDENEMMSIWSRSIHDGADAYGSGFIARLNGSNKRIDATAEVVGRSGRAFGLGADPMFFSAGALQVTDLLDNLELTTLGAESVAGYHMTMSSDVPGYEDLYAMQVLLEDGASPQVFFESNPLIGLDDDSIIAAIEANMTFDSGMYFLDSPLSISFELPDTGQDFSIEFSSATFAATVPAPATSLLLSVGGVLVFRRHRHGT